MKKQLFALFLTLVAKQTFADCRISVPCTRPDNSVYSISMTASELLKQVTPVGSWSLGDVSCNEFRDFLNYSGPSATLLSQLATSLQRALSDALQSRVLSFCPAPNRVGQATLTDVPPAQPFQYPTPSMMTQPNPYIGPGTTIPAMGPIR